MKHDEQYPGLLNQFLDQLRTQGKSENTLLNYGKWIDEYINYIKSIKYFKNDRVFGSIVENDVWQYVKYLSNKKGKVRGIKGNNGNTINRKIASVRTFYNFLVEKKIIEYNLFDKIKGVKQSKKVREDFTEEEIERLILAIQNSKDKFSLRNATFFIILIDTGARKMELANLTLKQNKDNKYLVFEGKGDKEREVYFSEMGTKALEKYFVWRENYLKEKNRTSDYLFFTQTGNSFDDSYISKMLKKYGKIADINEEKLTPHNIRHFFATLKYNSGIDMRMIQELLGHSVITTTQIYIGVSREKKQEAAYNTRKLNIQI